MIVSSCSVDTSFVGKSGFGDELVRQASGEAKRTFIGLARVRWNRLTASDVTHAEGAPNAKLALSADGCRYTIACGDLEGTEAVIDKILKSMWDGGEKVYVQELARIIWVWNIFGDPAQRSIVIHATGPNLRKTVSI
jgi:hypothetical protein